MDFFLKNGRFSGRIWPDWGYTTWADLAGLGSIGLDCEILESCPPPAFIPLVWEEVYTYRTLKGTKRQYSGQMSQFFKTVKTKKYDQLGKLR